MQVIGRCDWTATDSYDSFYNSPHPDDEVGYWLFHWCLSYMQEFYALKRRCFGQEGNSLKCTCFVAVSALKFLWSTLIPKTYLYESVYYLYSLLLLITKEVSHCWFFFFFFLLWMPSVGCVPCHSCFQKPTSMHTCKSR